MGRRNGALSTTETMVPPPSRTEVSCMAELRRQSRILYNAKVRLRAPGREHSVIARVQNLSARGIFVTGAEIPEAGTVVQCRFNIAGERRTLRGRVAWVRPGPRATSSKSTGAGIEFLELDKS